MLKKKKFYTKTLEKDKIKRKILKKKRENNTRKSKQK